VNYMNQAAWDRALRIALGVVMLYLGWSGAAGSGWSEVLKYGASLPVLTGIAGFCPAYALLRVRTKRC
jgi:hypothetical protein